MRTGNPCSRGSASPFIPTASSAPRSRLEHDGGRRAGGPAVDAGGQQLVGAGVHAGVAQEVAQGDADEAWRWRRASPPTSLDTQVSVRVRSTSGRASRSANESVSSRSTMPWTRSVQSAAESAGTRSAASIR